MVNDRTRPRSQRGERAVHHRHEQLSRGLSHHDHSSGDQGVVLDERHQEQPADKSRARAQREGGLNRTAPPSPKD